jgi:hypothetical protein
MALCGVKTGEPDGVGVVPREERLGGGGQRALGRGDEDMDAGGGAVGRVGVETEGLEGIGEGEAEVESVERFARIPRRWERVDQGTHETPGNDGGEDGDGFGLGAVAGQDQACFGGRAAVKGLFEVGEFLGSGEELVVVLACGAG